MKTIEMSAEDQQEILDVLWLEYEIATNGPNKDRVKKFERLIDLMDEERPFAENAEQHKNNL